MLHFNNCCKDTQIKIIFNLIDLTVRHNFIVQDNCVTFIKRADSNSEKKVKNLLKKIEKL